MTGPSDDRIGRSVTTPVVEGADARREGAWLAAIVAVAFALRVWVARKNPVIFDDGPAFIEIARALARGDFASALAHPYHPLYSTLIWLTPGSSGHEEAVGVAWSVAAGTTAVVALWWLVRPFFGPRLALVAAALLAAHPYAVRFSGDVQSDQLHLALFLTASGLLARALWRGCRRRALATGMLAALAYLTRPEGAGVGVVGAALAIAGALRGHWPLRRAMGFVAALGAGAAVLALPYVGCIWFFSGELRLTQKKSLTVLLGLGDLLSPETDLVVPVGVFAVAVGLAWASRARLWTWAVFLRERRFGVFEVAAALGCGLLVVCMWAPAQAVEFAALFVSTLRPELSVLLVVGIVWSANRGERPGGRAFFFLAFCVVYGVATFGLLQTAGYLDRRHLLPLAALLLSYAALGLEVAADACARRLGTTRARATVALVLVCAAVALPKTLRLHRSEEVAGREAAEWVRAQADPGDRIASLRPKAAYYAALVWVPLLDADGLRDGDALRRLGARWVLVETGDLASPDGEHLAVTPAAGQRFEPVFETERHGHRAIVFEVHEPEPGFGAPSP